MHIMPRKRRGRVDQSDCQKHASARCETDFAADEILQQLHRILDSPDFNGTSQQRDFLAYVVSETLAGNSMNIKQIS